MKTLSVLDGSLQQEKTKYLVQTKVITWPAYERDKVACCLGSFLKIILGGVPHSVRVGARGQLGAVVSLPTIVRVLGMGLRKPGPFSPFTC